MTTRQIIEGPAVVQFDGYLYYSEGDITVESASESRVISSAWFGPVERRVTDKSFTVGFTPVGMLDSPAAYYPYGRADLGRLVAPAEDKDIVIWSAAGAKLTLRAGLVTRRPQLLLGTDRGPFGEMGLTAMGALAKAAADDESMYMIQQAQLAAHTFDLAKILTPGYKAELLDAEDAVQQTWDAEEGFTFDQGLRLDARKVNAYGTVNYKLSAIEPKLTFTPVGPAEADMLALLRLQGDGAAHLGAANTLGLRLRVSPVAGAGVTLEFADCQLNAAPLRYGRESPRHGQWEVTPALTLDAATGAASLYTLAFPDFEETGQ